MPTVRKIELMYQRFGKDTNRMHCYDCSNLVRVNTGNSCFHKCKVYGVTNSEASDWKASNIACGMLNKEYDGLPIIRSVKPNKKEAVDDDGQMSLF